MVTNRPRPRWLALATLLLALMPAAAPADEFFFVLIFGSEDDPKHLRNSHTWATFVRAVGEGPDPANYQLYVHTISWYPATLDVHVWRPWSEPGVNMTLEQTLHTVLSHGENVRLWGPFIIGPPVYNRSIAVYNELMSGRVRYRAISGRRDLYVSDCIHAVAAIDPQFGRNHYPLIRVGHPASRYIAREFMIRAPERGIDQTAYDLSWLIPRLGLDRYPITVVPPRAIDAEPCVLCRHPE